MDVSDISTRFGRVLEVSFVAFSDALRHFWTFQFMYRCCFRRLFRPWDIVYWPGKAKGVPFAEVDLSKIDTIIGMRKLKPQRTMVFPKFQS